MAGQPGVVLMSGQGQAVRDITSLMQVSADYVRDVIHAFNERGFEALHPKWSGGCPRTIGEQVRQRICLIARTSPADWGITAFSTWSLSTLAAHFIAKMHRVLDLYDHPLADGRMICVDEFGPLNPQPRKGKAWLPTRSPRRQRAMLARPEATVPG